VKSAIGTREILEVEDGGIRLRGTFHNSPGGWPSSPTDRGGMQIGVFLLNPGVLPRAATGNTAVYWADSLARRGYPSFRFDFPGLGDSDGELPQEVIDFQTLVNEGGHASILSRLVSGLVERFNLRGMVVLGHCAGAVSAIHAAVSNTSIKGLILLDPYFHVQQKIGRRSVLSQWKQQHMRTLESEPDGSGAGDRHRLRAALYSGIHGVYGGLKSIRKLMRGKELPDNANLPLIRSWNQLGAGSLPMLVLRAGSSTPKSGEFDYLGYLLPRLNREGRVSFRAIAATTHSFAEPLGREGVRESAEEWLTAHFPAPGSSGTAPTGGRPVEFAELVP